MPGHGAVRIILDAAFTTTFDQPGALALALGWLAALTLAASVVFGRLTTPARA